jgi:probable HAF family extracellular repeat protein
MRTHLAPVVSLLLPLLALTSGCTDDPLPSAPKSAARPSATVYAATASAPSVLGTWLGSTYNIAYGINDFGDIAGVSGEDQHAIRWATGTGVAPSSVVAIGVDPRSAAVARDINVAGEIVGWVGPHAMLWAPAALPIDIGQQLATWDSRVETSQAHAINGNGTVTGTYDFHNAPDSPLQTRCWLWTPTSPNGTTGNISDLGDLGGGFCYAQDINSAGVVTGGSLTVAGDFTSRHAFVWANAGGMIDISPADAPSEGEAINDGGQVTGFRTLASGLSMATVWTPSNLGQWFVTSVGAPTLTGQNGQFMQSAALDINDAGFVVGYSRDEHFVDRAFFWQNGVSTELPDPSGVVNEPSALTNLLNDVVIVAGGNILNQSTNSRQALRWAVTLTPVSPLSCVGDLVALVSDMQRVGTLRSGEARSLLAKLNGVTRQVSQGNTTPARNLIDAFVNEVNALVASGRLTTEQARPLLDGARCALAAL